MLITSRLFKWLRSMAVVHLKASRNHKRSLEMYLWRKTHLVTLRENKAEAAHRQALETREEDMMLHLQTQAIDSDQLKQPQDHSVKLLSN